MKKIFEITDEGKSSVQPVLSIEFGEKHCCFSITDFTTKALRKLAYYKTDEINDNFLDQLLSLHPELEDPFYQVLICYDYPHSSLVPSTVYKVEEKSTVLSCLTGSLTTNAVITESINEWQLHNVYAVPQDIHQGVSKSFSKGKYWHRNTINIKNNNASIENGVLMVNIRSTDFTVLASANGKILLARVYSYAIPDDILFYLIKICEQFGLQQEKVQIKLSGLIEQQSILYKDMYQYFLNITFRNTEWKAPVNDDSPAHFFTSLNDLTKCAL